MVINQDDVSEEVRRGPVDDAVDGSLDYGQCFVKVDQHNANGRQIFGVFPLQTPGAQSKTAMHN